ncbi:hypothetical protein DVK07_14035 [Halorubrum sp. Atlit-26R]|nr:hypothetical protein DVK07_14035 [Halorubrum sp. Atlit-26R]
MRLFRFASTFRATLSHRLLRIQQSTFDLIPALPDGPETVFEADGVRVPAVDLGLVHGHHLAFPYRSADTLVDDVMAALRADNVLSTRA